MLQITSNTGEINTGPELVQNGSFNQLGTDQVQNGSFAEVSSTDVITDGGFSATGTEIITDGNFPLGTSAWNVGTGWSIANDKASVDATSTTVLQQSSLSVVDGKSYKISGEIKDYVSGELQIEFSASNIVGNVTANGVFTFYGEWGASNILYLYALGTSKFSVTNISVKELGTDWTQGLGWSIGENKANSAQALGSQLITNGNFTTTGSDLLTPAGNSPMSDVWGNNGVITNGKLVKTALGIATRINNAITAGKSYKAVVDVESLSGATNFYLTGNNSQNLAVGINTVYIVAGECISCGAGINNGFSGGVGSVIKSISVQELGEGWTVQQPTGQTVSFNGTQAYINYDKTATQGSTGINQTILQSGKTYKIVLDIDSLTGDAGNKLRVQAGGATIDFSDSGVKTFYLTTLNSGPFFIVRASNGTSFETYINSVTVEEISTSYLQQDGVLVANKSWKFNYTVSNYSAGTVSATDFGKVISANGAVVDFVNLGATSDFSIKNIDGYFVGSVSAVSAFRVDPNNRWNVGTGWVIGDDVAIKGVGVGTLSQGVSPIATKFYRVTFTVVSFTSDPSTTELNIDLGGAAAQQVTSTGAKTLYFRAINTTDLRFYGGGFRGSLTNVVVEQLDPNNRWTVSTGDGAGIEFNKAVFTLASIGANFSQSTFTIVNGRTYRASIALLTTTAGFLELRTSKALLIGDPINTSGVKSFDFVGDGSTGFNIKTSSISGNSQQFTGVSIKQLGSYSDQSIYVTVKDRQTIALERIVYLIELTSLGSLNSLYFIPSSVVASNGRFTKMNFTVVSTDATPQPTLGIISFYDSTGGRDTYPMGFYTYKIYEQTSSTNLDPTLATKQLQQGMAYVHDYLGNMKEVTPPFNEYTPTPIQYIYP